MKFIVDMNVGRLAVWLRALGYDTLFINPIEDDDLIEIARREGRTILTKDTGILRRRVVTSGAAKALYVEGDEWRGQLAQVVRDLHLTRSPSFSRCLACNVPLEARTREEARPHVPPFVHQTQREFLTCPECGRFYWKGTHWQRMTEELEQAASRL